MGMGLRVRTQNLSITFEATQTQQTGHLEGLSTKSLLQGSFTSVVKVNISSHLRVRSDITITKMGRFHLLVKGLKCKHLGWLEKFCFGTVASTAVWIHSLLACPTGFTLADLILSLPFNKPVPYHINTQNFSLALFLQRPVSIKEPSGNLYYRDNLITMETWRCKRTWWYKQRAPFCSGGQQPKLLGLANFMGFPAHRRSQGGATGTSLWFLPLALWQMNLWFWTEIYLFGPQQKEFVWGFKSSLLSISRCIVCCLLVYVFISLRNPLLS
jgi:hypothetical protein